MTLQRKCRACGRRTLDLNCSCTGQPRTFVEGGQEDPAASPPYKKDDRYGRV